MALGTSRARAGTTVIAAVVLVTVASLGAFAWQRLASPPAAVGAADISGLTTEVQRVGWVDFDHGHVMDLDGGPGFMMPDQMMPGAPSLAGDQARIAITVTLTNTSSRTREFNLAGEFSVTGGGDRQPQPLVADSFGAFPRLAPGAAINGTLYFDVAVPLADHPPLYLVWQRDGRTARLPVPAGDQTPGPEEPGHGH